MSQQGKNQPVQQPAKKNQSTSQEVKPVKAGFTSLSPEQQVEAWFNTHGLSEDQQNRVVAFKAAAHQLGLSILKNSKTSADQTASLRKLRELTLILVQAISLEEVGN